MAGPLFEVHVCKGECRLNLSKYSFSCNNRIYVQRPIPDVLRYIEALGTRHIFFADDNFIGAPAYTRKLLYELQGTNLIWGAAVTTTILNEPELLDLMAETSCQSLFIGFESISPRALQNVHKNNRVERYEAVIGVIRSRRITNRNLSNYNSAHVVFAPAEMNEKQLHVGCLWMYCQFCSFKNILRRYPRHKAQRTPFLFFFRCFFYSSDRAPLLSGQL